jgi:hypothetical protein
LLDPNLSPICQSQQNGFNKNKTPMLSWCQCWCSLAEKWLFRSHITVENEREPLQRVIKVPNLFVSVLKYLCLDDFALNRWCGGGIGCSKDVSVGRANVLLHGRIGKGLE